MLLRRRHKAAEAEQAGAPEETLEAPAGNASRDAWNTYALAQGKSAEDLEGLGRDEIRDLFKDPEQADAEPDAE